MALATIPLAFIGNLFAVIFAYIIGGICGIGVMIQLAYESSFAVPRRVRDVKPKILDQLDFEHGFLRVPTYHGFKNESEPLRDSEIRLHYVAAGEPGRPLMLFIHGFPDLWFGWRHQLQHFRSHFRVVAIDNRGYGESDKPTDRRAYTLPLLVRDVRSVIQQMGYEKCILVGHDWGGLISWTFAAVFPEMVDLLIVMNCPHPLAFSRMPFGDLIRQFFKSWYIFFFQLPYLPERMFLSNDLYRVEAMLTQPPLCRTPSAVTPEEVEVYKYYLGKDGALRPLLNYYRNLIRVFPPPMPSLMGIRPPVHLLHGTGDPALSVSAAERSRECVAGTFQLRLLDGYGHWINQEAPFGVHMSMEEFMSQAGFITPLLSR